jgi:tRNA (cmo5U34)-methyltransferase
MEKIKAHFEEEAKKFDGIIIKLIPYYNQMVMALVDSIPFKPEYPIRVIDLGCGTGTIARQISLKFPNSRIVCMDIASNMIEIAKNKLSEHENTEYITGDFSRMKFDREFDVVVSSLALHHLETDKDKTNFYRLIFNALSEQGIFYNADVVLGSTKHNQEVNMKRWIEFMGKNVPKKEIFDTWIPKYKEEDKPARLTDQLNWLKEIGFQSVDVIWKYYNFSVYGGSK